MFDGENYAGGELLLLACSRGWSVCVVVVVVGTNWEGSSVALIERCTQCKQQENTHTHIYTYIHFVAGLYNGRSLRMGSSVCLFSLAVASAVVLPEE